MKRKPKKTPDPMTPFTDEALRAGVFKTQRTALPPVTYRRMGGPLVSVAPDRGSDLRSERARIRREIRQAAAIAIAGIDVEKLLAQWRTPELRSFAGAERWALMQALYNGQAIEPLATTSKKPRKTRKNRR